MNIKEVMHISILPIGVLLVAVGAWLLTGAPEVPGAAADFAPDFSLPVVAGHGAEEGDRINLGGHEDKVLVLDFWAGWCGVCERATPMLNRLGESDDRIAMVGVNIESNLEPGAIQESHRRFGANFPSVQDDGSLQAAFNVTAIPTLVIIAPGGEVVSVESGIPPEGSLDAKIRSILD